MSLPLVSLLPRRLRLSCAGRQRNSPASLSPSLTWLSLVSLLAPKAAPAPAPAPAPASLAHARPERAPCAKRSARSGVRPASQGSLARARTGLLGEETTAPLLTGYSDGWPLLLVLLLVVLAGPAAADSRLTQQGRQAVAASKREEKSATLGSCHVSVCLFVCTVLYCTVL